MGSGLKAAIISIAVLALLPVSKAHADRTQNVVPLVHLSEGTYALTRVAGRRVGNADLAKSSVTFSTTGAVAVVTACNSFSTSLQIRTGQNQILGFVPKVPTSQNCLQGPKQAEAITTRLLNNTANIARAGNSITFFNNHGINIAQWTRVTPRLAPILEASAPQPGAPTPRRDYLSDYVLTELNGNPVALNPSRVAPILQRPRANQDAVPVDNATRLQALSDAPTVLLRKGGRVMGNSGCNQYMSSLVTLTNGRQRFGPVMASKKACLNQRMSEIERNFFTALRTANRIDIQASHIEIFALNGGRVAWLSAINNQSVPDLSLHNKKWVLRNLNGLRLRGNSRPTLTFRGNQATGTTSCASFTIQHIRQNAVSQFSNAVVIQNACPDTSQNIVDRQFMTGLGRISVTEMTISTLVLRSPDNQTEMILETE